MSKKPDFAYLLTRYILGTVMIAYGAIKILHLQFKLPPEVYTYELRQLDGVTVAWAFLGFSPWLSILLGVFEFIPGVLLLFRKTQLLGVVLLFPSLLVVFLINIAYDFLFHMQVFTGILLLLDLFLFIPGYKIFKEFYNRLLNQSSVSLIEVAINIVIICLVTALVIYNFKSMF
ncbi:MAG TPA: hypothetical protein VIT44_18075 [Cyclobacteriaceae bacterium]